jgi:hypothetical protein
LLAWPGAFTGALSVVRIAQQEAKGHLARAVAAFAPFASLPQPGSAGDAAAAATAAAAAAATAAADVDAANDAHWDDVGCEDEAWVPSDVDVDEEAELDMERDE